MTELDLRIKYKSITGFSPTTNEEWHAGSLINCKKYCGDLTNEYIEWLEGKSTNNRIQYSLETGLHSCWKDKKRITYYTQEYGKWLEETSCKIYSVLRELEK